MEKAKLVLGGDVMLGRGVGRQIEKRGVGYPLGGISELLKEADLAIVNLECAITSSKKIWSGEPKAFYFGAPVEAIDSLVQAGVDLVSLANNHVLDFDYAGLEDTLKCLDRAKIAFAGAGRNEAGAGAPAFFERNGIRFGMVAYCDHQEDFAAGSSSPGINYLDLSDEKKALSRFAADLERMAPADWPVLSVHWGPNMVHRPSAHFIRLARGAIEAGYGLVYGHSAHVFHGVEIYRGRPIFYSCGDLVDDYYVDPEFSNDHQLLFELEVSKSRIEKLKFHPIFIEDCRTIPAASKRREFVVERISRLCGEMGTRVIGESEIVF